MDAALLARLPGPDRSFAAFWDALPDVLAARDLRFVADRVAVAAGRRAVVAMLGGHVIKVGLGPLLRELMRRGVITHVAMNGSAAIHDFELAAFGGTSEDVAAGLGSIVVERRAVMNRGNDLKVWEALVGLPDGTWSEPIETLSEIHVCRREAARPAPTYEEIRAVVRGQLVDERAPVWLQEAMRDRVQLGRP